MTTCASRIRWGSKPPTRSETSGASSGRTSFRPTERRMGKKDRTAQMIGVRAVRARSLGGPQMRRRFLRSVVAVAAAVLISMFVDAGTLRADDKNDTKRPPQTEPQGFESHNELARDASPSKHAAQYSAWIVESSRFMDVPFRSFMPDRGDRPTVNLPVNAGITQAANGAITLYDTGWKQLAYIYDWNNSCCWYPIRTQMTKIGLNPDKVKRIVVGHAHWDHAGQLSEFPNAILYIQTEEIKQIDYFLGYPKRFNDGHIHAVNTV